MSSWIGSRKEALVREVLLYIFQDCANGVQQASGVQHHTESGQKASTNGYGKRRIGRPKGKVGLLIG